MSYSGDESGNLQPFPMRNLSGNSSGSVESIREKAAGIAAAAREQIERYRRETEEELRRKSEKLDRRAEELDRRENALNQREQSHCEVTAEDGWDQGYRDGYDAGREDGLNEGKEEAKAEWENKFAEEKEKKFSEWSAAQIPVMESLVSQLGGVRQSLLSYWEQNILQIAAAIAHQTIARELPRITELPLDLLREALDLAVGSAVVKIRMNPDDLQELRGQAESLLKEYSQITSAELIEDPRVTKGGCIVESSVGTIDQRLESRLERIIKELSR